MAFFPLVNKIMHIEYKRALQESKDIHSAEPQADISSSGTNPPCLPSHLSLLYSTLCL